MSDFQVRSDSVDVEQIMKQIRTRIREKRGADYTQQELQQLASVKLEQFADPSGLRSDLLEQFRQRSSEPSTYHRHRGLKRWVLMAMHPILTRMQKQVMTDLNLYFEIIHNLVVETTRLGIEVQNLKMKVESMSSRLDFDERRAKALEGVVQYRHDAPARHRPHEQRQPAPDSGNSVSSPVSHPGGGNSGGNAQPQGQPSYGGFTGRPGENRPAEGGRPGEGRPGEGRPGEGRPGEGRPGEARPEGGRRRRRRRRRRPGQTMGDRQPMPGGAPPQGGDAQPPANGGQDYADADGPDDDDGAPDQ